jgi:hypothetical protein
VLGVTDTVCEHWALSWPAGVKGGEQRGERDFMIATVTST